jgi:hypothetical protein
MRSGVDEAPVPASDDMDCASPPAPAPSSIAKSVSVSAWWPAAALKPLVPAALSACEARIEEV